MQCLKKHKRYEMEQKGFDALFEKLIAGKKNNEG